MTSITPRLNIVADENIPFVAEFFQSLGNVTTYPGRTLSAGQVRDADVLLVRSVTAVNEDLLAGSRVGFVGTCTIGIDHLDVDYLQSKGIAYHSAPGCNANSVVEYVFSVLARQKPDWLQASFGIIGCGNVGGHLYRRLTALGLACRCYDPFKSSDSQADLTELEQVLQADVVCLHTPLTTDGPFPTFHILDERRLRALKPGCLLINAGRGAAIDNQALKQVLAERADITAVLDVWEPEPLLDAGLLQQVAIASPHIAGYSYDGKVQGTAMIYAALCRHLKVDLAVAVNQLLGADESGRQTISLAQAAASTPDQALLNQCILLAYDVAEDDARMRQRLLSADCQADPQAFAEAFDHLRKHYPKRREFPCFAVAGLEPMKKKSLIKRLTTLGFTLVNREES